MDAAETKSRLREILEALEVADKALARLTDDRRSFDLWLSDDDTLVDVSLRPAANSVGDARAAVRRAFDEVE